MTVRCYLPLSAEQLEQLRGERRIAGPVDGAAVTPALTSSHTSSDRDELEDLALQEAARGAAAAGSQVIVAAVDLAEDRVEPRTGATPGAVRVGDVDLPRIAAFHLGDDVLEGAPRILGEDATGIELSWYDTTELDHVLDLAYAAARRSR